jgi:hypothetical protein
MMRRDRCLLLPKGGLNEGSAELLEAVYEADSYRMGRRSCRREATPLLDWVS